MKLIVGLGNPGKKYQSTRHNAGFLAVDDFIGEMMANPSTLESSALKVENKFKSEIIPLPLSQGLLAKPQTFMNNSGQAVKALCHFYKIDPALDLLVIHDDTDLPLGLIRTNMSSSAAGHNGVQNIIDQLGTQNFRRVRIGVETRSSRAQLPTEDFVLQNFTEEELQTLKKDVLPKVKLEVKKFIQT